MEFERNWPKGFWVIKKRKKIAFLNLPFAAQRLGHRFHALLKDYCDRDDIVSMFNHGGRILFSTSMVQLILPMIDGGHFDHW